MSKENKWTTVVAKPETFRVGDPNDNGHRRVSVALTIVKCDKDPSREGEEIWFNKYLLSADHPKASDSAKYLVRDLRTLGMTNDSLAQPEGLGRLQASCVEKWDSYGDGSYKVDGVFPPRDRARPQLDEAAADELSDRLGAFFAETEAAEATDANRAPETLPTATQGKDDFFSDEDECPF